MKHLTRLTLAILLSITVLGLSNGSISADNGAASVGYQDYATLTQAIKQISAVNPGITKLMSIGKTLKGRDLWLLQISGTRGGDPLEKQALLIVGNLEGDHLVGSEVALGIAGNLVKKYGNDEKITEVLDSRTFYIVPRLNPDGAEVFFAKVKEERSKNFKPRDEDYDWKTDEDGPDDLNGDGLITLMRVKDREGDWVIDDKDPRLMKKKKSDTPFEKLYKIYPEGLDDDRDGRYNEDAAGGFNINRNFPHNFGSKPIGLNVYAASENETRALIDFVLAYDPETKNQPHKNICGVLIFSKYDNLAAGTGIESGTPTFPQPTRTAAAGGMGMRMGGMMFRMGGRRGGQQAPEPRTPDPQPKKSETRDAGIFKMASDKYKEITGIKSAVSEQPVGSLLEWAYFQYGVPSFSANLWSLRKDAPARPQGMMQRGGQPGQTRTPQAKTQQRTGGEMQTMDRAAMMQRFAAGGRAGAAAQAGGPSSDTDEKWLKWIDDKNEGKGFVAWTKFDHKQLGEVEIGGFEPYLRVNPPAGQIPELVKTHTDFAVYLASQFAQIGMDEPKVEKLSSSLFKLKINVKNTGNLPYTTAMGARTTQLNSIMLQLKFQDDDSMELFGGSKRRDISTMAVGGEREFEWMIISPPGKTVDITLLARHGGGTTKKTVVLK